MFTERIALDESEEFQPRQQGQSGDIWNENKKKRKNVIYKSILPSYSLITCGQIFLVFHI